MWRLGESIHINDKPIYPNECWYITAVVTIYEPQKKTHNTVCFLNRGDSFGEQAIIHQSAREVSVVTKAITELLCITARDFINIFMSGLSNSEDPFFK